MPEEAVLIESAPDAAQLASFMEAGAAFTKSHEPAAEAPTPAVQQAAQPAPAKSVEAPVVTAPKPEQAIPEQILTGEAPKAEAEEPLDLEPPANLPKYQQKNWRRMRERLDNAETERDGIRKDLEAAKAANGKSVPSEEVQAQLKAANDRAVELEKIVERGLFEQSPRFQQFLTRENQNIASAKAYLEGTEINPNVIDLAAHSTGSARIKILKEAGLDPETIGAVAPYLADIDRNNADKTAAVAQHKEFREQDQAQERAQQEAQQTRKREVEQKVFKEVGDTIATKFTPFQKVEGQDKWNAQVEQLQAEAGEFFAGKLPLEKLAEIAYAGVAYRVESEINQSLREALKAAKAENAQLKAAQPDGGTQPQTPATNPNEAWNPADVAATFERNLRAQQAG